MSRNKEHRGAAFGGAPNRAAAIGSVFFVSAHISFCTLNIYGYSVYIPYIFHIYIYVLNIFHIFSFVCFVIYSANRFKSNFLIRGVAGEICSGTFLGCLVGS